jgi:Flp pilus assembly protein TadG
VWTPSPAPGSRGSVTTEVVLVTPVLVLLVLFVVAAGRAGQTVEQVRHAADQGARAASMVRTAAMPAVAEAAVLADLTASGVPCAGPSVTTSVTGTWPARSVTVTVRCRVPLRGLGPLDGPGQLVSASSTEVIDRYRGEP